MHRFSQHQIQDHLKDEVFHLISRTADLKEFECYVVGGYVRDILLGRPTCDIDVVVVGNGIEMAEAFAQQLHGKCHLSVFRNFGTAQVKWRNNEVEFVGARRESYTHDSRKPIVENGTLEDDQNPLRIMRCVRFATQLNFQIEEETFEALSKNAERLKIISAERIITELNKIVMSPTPSKGFVDLQRANILKIILPELSDLDIVESVNGRKHKNNFYHTLEVLDNVANNGADLWLRWAAILHDIGKTQSKRWAPSIGWTFHNHNYIGEKMIPGIFRRMKLPMDERMKFVKKLVGLHMRPIAIADDIVTDSAVRRLLFDAGDDIDSRRRLRQRGVFSRRCL